MKDYKYYGKCQVCNVDFKQSDEIVVCPECGTPYHRVCYESQGKCTYSDRHGTSFTYQGSVANNTQDGDENSSATEINKCPRCFNENPSNALFCSNCGMPLLQKDANSIFYEIPIPPALDPLRDLDKDEKIDDIKISEFAQYTKSNLLYYLPIFKSIHEKNKSRFNFAAFLFSGGWFLYRKLYKIGIAITVALMSLMILASFVEFVYVPQILSPLYTTVGITSTADFTVSKSNELLAQMALLPITQQFLLLAPSLIKIIQFVIMIFSGFFANRLYFKNCCSKIRKIKTLCKDDNSQLAEKMAKHGGTNRRAVTLLIICYMIIEYLPRFLI